MPSIKHVQGLMCAACKGWWWNRHKLSIYVWYYAYLYRTSQLYSIHIYYVWYIIYNILVYIVSCIVYHRNSWTVYHILRPFTISTILSPHWLWGRIFVERLGHSPSYDAGNLMLGSLDPGSRCWCRCQPSTRWLCGSKRRMRRLVSWGNPKPTCKQDWNLVKTFWQDSCCCSVFRSF